MSNTEKIAEHCENTLRKLQGEKHFSGKIFFAGIGGISMSAIADHLLNRGYTVYGYDSVRSRICSDLEDKGVKIWYSFSEEMFEGVELAVFTNAIHKDDPVYSYPVSKGIRCITRAEMLGAISLEKENRIGIAGTHGKSSTTGMLSSISLAASRDPAIFVGAELNMIDGTHRDGKGSDFIFEACEYMDSFLSFYPTVSVVLNTELDHVDYFGDLDGVIRSFNKYMDIPGETGYALINGDCANTVKASEGIRSKRVRFSLCDPSAEFFASDIREEKGFFSFVFNAFGKPYASITLSVPGRVYIDDALAAASAAYLMGIKSEDIEKGLKDFTGVKRRFELRGRCGKAIVVDDYAHHPDEIRSTLATARAMGFEDIICVFQPHTYTRTQALFKELCESFGLADRAIFADIYSARELPIEGITSLALSENTSGGEYYPSFEAIRDELMKTDKKEGTLIIIMGAGDIVRLTDMILTEKLSSFSEIIGGGCKA